MKRYTELKESDASRLEKDKTYSKMMLSKELQKELNIPGGFYFYQPINRRNTWPIYDGKGNETKWMYNIGTKKAFKM